MVITCSLTSILLNPVVFLYNNSKPRSIPKFLFQVLSAADFLTSLTVGPFLATMLLKDAPAGRVALEPATPFQKVYGIGNWYLIQTPAFVASVMAVCRYIQIKRPFQKIRFRLIVGVVAGVSVFNIVILCCILLTSHSLTLDGNLYALWPNNSNIFYPNTKDRLASIMSYFTLTWTATLGQPLSILASSLTILHLYITFRNPVLASSQQNGRRGSIKILLLNLGALIQTSYFLFAISNIMIVEGGEKGLIRQTMTIAATFPVFLSCLNPILFLALTPRVVETLWSRQRTEGSTVARTMASSADKASSQRDSLE